MLFCFLPVAGIKIGLAKAKTKHRIVVAIGQKFFQFLKIHTNCCQPVPPGYLVKGDNQNIRAYSCAPECGRKQYQQRENFEPAQQHRKAQQYLGKVI